VDALDMPPTPAVDAAYRACYGATRMTGISDEDAHLLEALRAGREDALAELLRRHHRATLRIARTYVGSDALAEEVAQEAWLGVVQGAASFEGRCSVRAWLFSIVANIGKRRGKREARSVPFSALEDEACESGPTVDPARFREEGRWAGNWAAPPARMPDEALLGGEVRALIARAIQDLPPREQRVIVLRDIEGVSAEEACAVLEITEANQRVLLHRARAKVRAAVEALLEKGAS
jgi:RNA polymerase sigma-70 factor (ECF subfamily)